MDIKPVTFDEVFLYWLQSEVESSKKHKLLEFVQSQKNFNSIAEWRLNAALRFELDTKQWREEAIANQLEVLPNIIVGPFKGWSKFFKNNLTTTFKQAVEIPEFKEWCSTHDRIISIMNNLPFPTKVIVLRKPNGDLIHIEGGHRICAIAYAQSIGKTLDFTGQEVSMFVADITETEVHKYISYIELGTDNQ